MRTLLLSRQTWIILGGLILATLSGLMVAFQVINYFIFLVVAVLCTVIIGNPRIGLYLMIFMVPLQYLTLLNNGITVIRLIGIVVFVSWMAQKVVKKESILSLIHHSIILPISAFLGICVLSVLWSDFITWQSTMMTFIQLAVWVIMLIDLIGTKEQLTTLLLVLLLGTLLSGGLSVYEFRDQISSWQFGQRGLGGFGDPNYSSASLMFAMPYALYLAKSYRGWLRLLGLFGIPILLTGIVFTVSRSGILAILFLVIWEILNLPKTNTKIKYILVFFLLVLASIPFWPWANINYRFSIAWTGGAPIDLGYRWGLMKDALVKFNKSPLIGYGLGYDPVTKSPVHNLFLGLVVQLGIFGLLTMVWIWWVTWRNLSKAYKQSRSGSSMELPDLIFSMQSSAIVYLFFSLTLSNEGSRLLWLLFALAAICYRLVFIVKDTAERGRIIGEQSLSKRSYGVEDKRNFA